MQSVKLLNIIQLLIHQKKIIILLALKRLLKNYVLNVIFIYQEQHYSCGCKYAYKYISSKFASDDK